MSSRIFSLALIFLSTWLSAAKVNADPITTFNVQIGVRAVPNVAAQPFDTAFQLTVTFDDTVTHEVVVGDGLVRFFGPPRFSAVPLALPERPPDEPFIIVTGKSTRLERGFNPISNTWFEFGEIAYFEHNNVAVTGKDYSFVIVMNALRSGTAKPNVTAPELINLFGSGSSSAVFSPYNILISGVLMGDGEFAENSFVYLGTVTAATSPDTVVPEPSTLALLAFGGLAVVGRLRGRYPTASSLPSG